MKTIPFVQRFVSLSTPILLAALSNHFAGALKAALVICFFAA